MSYCFNPTCDNPENRDYTDFCQNCNSPLLLRNRYRAVRFIEDGNFGRTLLAEDADRLSAPCIIKQFFKWRKIEDSASAMKRATQIFEKEAKLLLQLGDHSQIPTLLACFEEEKILYLVQEFIVGQNLLEELFEEGCFSEQEVRDLLADLLAVLKFIHDRNVIHRDIKPMNIIRRQSDRKFVLVDYGLAKQLSGTAVGQTGSKYGTEGYAPIEQTRGKVYPASDLFSLGVTCIQLLTGTVIEELYDAEQGVWKWREYLRGKGTDVSDKLYGIVEKLTKDSLKERYQSTDEVLADLREGLHRWQCVHTFTGHFGTVNRVTFSADGETLASGSDDKTLKVWHLSSGRLMRSLNGESQGVKFAVLSPNGEILASGTGDSTIQIWHPTTEKLLHTLIGHQGAVNQVVFSPDGQTLISGGEDSTVKFWDVSTGKLRNTLTGHSNAIIALVVSHDGRYLATGGEDKTIRIWHLGSGVLLHTLTEHSKKVNTLSLSVDGQLLASGSADNSVRIWHLGSGKLMDILWGHSGAVESIAFSPDGNILASGSQDRTIKIWQPV